MAETNTRLEFRAMGVAPNNVPEQGYCGPSLRAARISAAQMTRYEYTRVEVQQRALAVSPWQPCVIGETS